MYIHIVVILIIFCFEVFRVQSLKALVIGATGRVGKSVVSKLVDSGIRTTCLVRDINKATSLTEKSGVLLIRGNVNDLQSLIEATSDCDLVIDVHGVNPPRFTRLTDIFRHPKYDLSHPFNVNYIGVQNVLSAMKKNNVRKIVRLTGSSVGRSSFSPVVALFNIILSMTVRWHERAEIAIRESGIDYTILRVPEIVNEPAARDSNRSLQVFSSSSPTSTRPKSGKISVTDVADMCVLAGTGLSLYQSTVAKYKNVLSKSTVICSSLSGKSGAVYWDELLHKVNKSDTNTLKIGRHRLAVLTYLGLATAIITSIGKLILLIVSHMSKKFF